MDIELELLINVLIELICAKEYAMAIACDGDQPDDIRCEASSQFCDIDREYSNANKILTEKYF